MSTNSIALPRVKTKRKKRKPPRFWFWYAAFWLLVCIAGSVFDILRFLTTGSVWSLVLLGFQITIMLIFWWPMFLIEWNLWRDGDDD